MSEGRMRSTLPGARADRLYFAQVREDPRLEIETLLRPGTSNRVVVVGSGGCTALSLLAAGASEVFCVDVNPVQNHLVELKLAAACALSPEDAIAFLGGEGSTSSQRLATYARLRETLTPAARDHWDHRRRAIAAGANLSGVTERFLGVIAFALRTAVVGRRRIERMLASEDVEQQRALFEREWRGPRWNALFAILCSRAAVQRTYDAAFFRNASHGSFAEHFRSLAEHTLTQLAISDNYFLHQMLGRGYHVGATVCAPPYLAETSSHALAAARDRLALVDGAMTEFLRTQPSRSIDAFALSNICEWLEPHEVLELFSEVVRTAAPHARLVFRNFVGWTEVPERWRAVIMEDRAAGDALIRRDRSGVQRRIAVCRIESAEAAA